MHSRTPLSLIKRAAATPDLLIPIVKGLLKKHFAVNYDYYLKGGRSDQLTQISIKITNLCNLRCKMCGQWGETGYNLGKAPEEISKVVPFSTYSKMVDDVKSIKPFFYIWGGEPFLYPDIMPLLRHIKKNNMITAIVTNGIRLRDHAKELVDIGIDALMLSLDGPKDVHNQIRGTGDCYQKLVEGIRSAQEEKKLRGTKKPYIMLLSTISKYNAPHLEAIFEEAAKLSADCLVVYYSWFTTPEIGQAHTKVMQECLDCTPFAWRGYTGDFSRVDTTQLKSSIARLRKKRYPFHHIFIPDLKPDEIDKYYESPKNMFGYSRCISPWLTAEIMPNGDVSLCRDYPDFRIGNITEQPILEIFNGDRAKKFRNALKKQGGLFPICARCCGLMGW